MNPQAFDKDSQNPYRTGVLIGNHTEDRFGQELASTPYTKWQPVESEMKSNFHIHNSMFGAGRENHVTKPRTEDEIVDDLAHKEMEAHLNPKKGQAT